MLDAQNSYNFIKKEKLRVDHEKNLLEIQIKQYEDIYQNRNQESEIINNRLQEYQEKYREEQIKCMEMGKIIEEKEEMYKGKLVMINKELEGIAKKKNQKQKQIY